MLFDSSKFWWFGSRAPGADLSSLLLGSQACNRRFLDIRVSIASTVTRMGRVGSSASSLWSLLELGCVVAFKVALPGATQILVS